MHACSTKNEMKRFGSTAPTTKNEVWPPNDHK